MYAVLRSETVKEKCPGKGPFPSLLNVGESNDCPPLIFLLEIFLQRFFKRQPLPSSYNLAKNDKNFNCMMNDNVYVLLFKRKYWKLFFLSFFARIKCFDFLVSAGAGMRTRLRLLYGSES